MTDVRRKCTIEQAVLNYINRRIDKTNGASMGGNTIGPALMLDGSSMTGNPIQTQTTLHL